MRTWACHCAGRATAYYGDAEAEIGVSADVAHQRYLGVTFPQGYQYPNPEIPLTLTDQMLADVVNGKMQFEGQPITVYPTPAGRNSRPYDNRRVCAGNTNCIPICPIQAKYDPTITLNKALDTGNVEVRYQTVASNVKLDVDKKMVVGIDYIHYSDPTQKSPDGTGTAVGRIYVVAAHGIEAPKLLLNSNQQLAAGVANSSGQVGLNLMDHPLYLTWGLTPKPTFPYRGPLATAGIESLRDGPFRANRAAFRVEFGNEGWNFTNFDPETTILDFVDGRVSAANPQGLQLSGKELFLKLNDIFTRQFRFGFLIEQSPSPDNCVTLSSQLDELGIPRPRFRITSPTIQSSALSPPRRSTQLVFAAAGVERVQKPLALMQQDPGYFSFTDPSTGKTFDFEYHGSGHIVGTCRMGDAPGDSVVSSEQRSWDHPNLFVVGSGVFPTVATGNPSLTIVRSPCGQPIRSRPSSPSRPGKLVPLVPLRCQGRARSIIFRVGWPSTRGMVMMIRAPIARTATPREELLAIRHGDLDVIREPLED